MTRIGLSITGSCEHRAFGPSLRRVFGDPGIDPGDRALVTYRETVGGCRALATLDWDQVFRHTPPGIAFAHALFEDLADALAVPNPFPGTSHPLTRRLAGGVLRNLA